MRVRIVCYEDVNAWILGKFALKLQEYLNKLNIEVDIAKEADKTADINHHIIYESFNGIKSNNDTLMITHIDSHYKLSHLQKTIESAALGICMSKDTLITLNSLGIPRDKLCYINPAHDNHFIPKKIVVGFTSRWYADGRKRDFLLKDLAHTLDPDFFEFKIMGQGWNFLIDLMISKGFKVEYISDFNADAYRKMLSEMDYFLYTGTDEGQMGFVDALASGVKTIVTPQGYHLDVENGITHRYNNSKELLKIFSDIYHEKRNLIKSVENWTWENYTKKHLELWYHLLGNEKQVISNFEYKDGIHSLSDVNTPVIKKSNTIGLRLKLIISGYKRIILLWYPILTSGTYWKNKFRELWK